MGLSVDLYPFCDMGGDGVYGAADICKLRRSFLDCAPDLADGAISGALGRET